MTREGPEQHPFILAGYGDKVTIGVVHVTRFHKSERLARAAKGLGVFWGASVVSVFIPVAHFVLVPVFAFAGMFLFARRWSTAEVTNSIVGSCPDCGLQQDFGAAGRWDPPHALACRQCHRHLTARSPHCSA